MKVGERAMVHVPSVVGYGAQPQGRQGAGWYIPGMSVHLAELWFCDVLHCIRLLFVCSLTTPPCACAHFLSILSSNRLAYTDLSIWISLFGFAHYENILIFFFLSANSNLCFDLEITKQA